MEFYINGTKADITLENEKTIGDVLRSFEEECAKNDATTVNIILDGHLISAAEFDEATSAPIQENTKLELAVISKTDIISAFKRLSDKCTSTAEQMETLAVKFQSGKDGEANSIITSLADLIDEVCNTSTLSALFPEIYQNFKIDGKTVNEFFQEFQPILSDFEKSIESKDNVLTGDLAEYEISPRLKTLAQALNL